MLLDSCFCSQTPSTLSAGPDKEDEETIYTENCRLEIVHEKKHNRLETWISASIAAFARESREGK